MRIAFIGAGEVTVMTAKTLIQQQHEVIIIESDRGRIETLSEEMDCSFIHGDGGKPSILQEVGPKQTDLLFCLSDNDQANVIASLVGRSLGFTRIITSIEDLDFEPICQELGLEDLIIPARTISRHLLDMVEGLDSVELSTVLKDEARFFTFTVGKSEVGSIQDLDLPEECRPMCLYRKDRFSFADRETSLQQEDEVILLTHRKNLPSLKERWAPKQAKEQASKESGSG